MDIDGVRLETRWFRAGLVVIAAWNYYAIDRLLRCKAMLDQGSRGAEDVDVNQTYAFIGRKALGDGGTRHINFVYIVTHKHRVFIILKPLIDYHT